MNKCDNILIVDDDPDVCSTLKDVLELEGYRVECASDGFKCLEAAVAQHFDAVLMDVKMPVMNGVETFKKLKQKSPETPVIMMSAFAVEELIHEALDEGAFAALHKPLDFDLLFDTINAACTSSKGAMVLVVDDEQALCEALKASLETHGYVVSVAFSGEEALSLVGESEFDIIILDMKLPTLNGLETYLEIRKIREHAVVIVITGYPEEMLPLARQAVTSSAYVCLEKPIDMTRLFSLLDAIRAQIQSGNVEKPAN